MATLPRSSTPPHCRANTATRAPSSPELRRHLSFATRAPSSPELRDQSSTFTKVPPFTRASSSPELQAQRSTFFRAPSSTELRRHLRFATAAPPARRFVVACRHLSFATRAPPSSELHLLPELHLRLPRLHHSMSFYFKPLPTSRQLFFFCHYRRPRRRRHHLLRQSGNYFTDFCSHAPRGLPLQTATSGKAPSSWPLPPTPGSSHSQRRPAGTYFADSCSHRAGRSAPSVRY